MFGSGERTPDGWRVFVGCLPSETTEERLAAYFSRFGTVFSVELQYRNQKDWERGLNSGYCFLTLGSSASANRVLAEKIHRFEGRNLICRKFIQGESLVSFNHDSNQRRVVVKNIPWDCSQKELEAVLVNFGNTESVFFFPRKPQPGLSSWQLERQPKTASVHFVRKSDAIGLVARGSITLRGDRFKVETYVRRRQAVTETENKQCEPNKQQVPIVRAKETKGMSNRDRNVRDFLFNLGDFKPTHKGYHSRRHHITIASCEPSANLRYNVTVPRAKAPATSF